MTPATTSSSSEPESESESEPNGEKRADSVGARLVALLIALGLALAGLLVGVAFVVALLLSGVVSIASVTAGGTTVALLAALVTSELGFLLVGLVYARRRLPGLRASVPTRTDAGWIVASVAGALVLANGLHALATQLGLDPIRSAVDPTGAGGFDPIALLAVGVLSIVLIGPAEEMLFRGAIQGRLRRSFGPVVAIGVAGLLFASLHVFNFAAGPPGVAFATGVILVVGVVFGVAYERTGNLAVPILAHGTYNFVLMALAYAAAVGPF